MDAASTNTEAGSAGYVLCCEQLIGPFIAVVPRPFLKLIHHHCRPSNNNPNAAESEQLRGLARIIEHGSG
jgi:hypothetical protein